MMLAVPRPFRFSVQAMTTGSRLEWQDLARRAADLGFAALYTPDHLDQCLSPLAPLVSAADAALPAMGSHESAKGSHDHPSSRSSETQHSLGHVRHDARCDTLHLDSSPPTSGSRRSPNTPRNVPFPLSVQLL